MFKRLTLLLSILAMPIVGFATIYSSNISNTQMSEVVADAPNITVDVPDTLNLLLGGRDIDMSAHVNHQESGVTYDFSYELKKTDVVEIKDLGNGKYTIHPISSGLCALVISATNVSESKQIIIHVLDKIFDVATIAEPSSFHYAYQDLTLVLFIRGISNIRNIDVTWEVLNKKGEALRDDQYMVHSNATITLLKPDSDDYTVTAYYENIKIASITTKVRYADLNTFMKNNVWWVVLFTAVLLAFTLTFYHFTKKGKQVIDYISKIYYTFTSYKEDNNLSKKELWKLKKQLSLCLRLIEDLNIETFNQYDRPIKRLRTALEDIKYFHANFETLSQKEKDEIMNKLEADLHEAYQVTSEIENARGLLDDYHTEANKNNIASTKEDKSHKHKKKHK